MNAFYRCRFNSSLPIAALILLLGATSTACGFVRPSLTPISYATQPLAVENPEEELKALIMANANHGCVIADAHVTGGMFLVRAVCPYTGGGQAVIRLREVASISLARNGEWNRVTVTHGQGVEDFLWESKSLRDVQRMADCVAAMTQKTAAKATPIQL